MSRHVQFAQYSMGQGHTFGDRAIASVPFEIQETQSPKFLGVQGHHYEGSDPHPTSSTEGCKRVQGGSLGCIPRHAEMLRFGHPTLEELIARLNARIGKGNASLNPGSYPPSFKKGVLTDKVVADVLNKEAALVNADKPKDEGSVKKKEEIETKFDDGQRKRKADMVALKERIVEFEVNAELFLLTQGVPWKQRKHLGHQTKRILMNSVNFLQRFQDPLKLRN
ncbi:hypothetical protein BGX20_010089 [Mortierella sp. AD010]|nr:hypothetical protein BGX20_010089 [Mortierella sp. AD010]